MTQEQLAQFKELLELAQKELSMCQEFFVKENEDGSLHLTGSDNYIMNGNSSHYKLDDGAPVCTGTFAWY